MFVTIANNNVISSIRILSGLVFLFSSVSKALYTGSFVFLIEQYGFETISQAAPTIIIIESILGLGLVINLHARFFAFVSFLLTILFTVAYLYAFLVNDINDCGCFGILNLNTSPTLTIIRNILLLTMLYIVFKKSQATSSVSTWKLVIAAIIIAAVSFTTGFTYFDQIPDTDKHSDSFLQKPLNQTPLTHYVQKSKKKTLVFCFSYGCPHCINSFGNLLLYRQHVDTIIAIALEDSLQKQEFLRYVKPDIEIIDIPFEPMNNITTQLPTTLFIKNDTIVYRHTGFLPSPIILRHIIDSLQ